MRKLFYLTLVLVSIFSILPFAAKFGLLHYLQNQNLDANLDSVSINPFIGKVSISGLHYYHENNSLHLTEVSLDVSLSALFDRKLLLEEVSLLGLHTSVEQTQLGWNIGGLLIPTQTDSAEEKSPESDDDPWGIGIEKLAFANVVIDVSSQFINSSIKMQELNFQELYSWQPQNASLYRIAVRLNESPVAISGSVYPFAQPMILDAEVKIEDLGLTQFDPILKASLEKIQGDVFADFQLNLEIDSEQTQLILNGEYGLSSLDLGLTKQQVNVEKISWSGQQKIAIAYGDTDINLSGSITATSIKWLDEEKSIELNEELLELHGDINIVLAEDEKIQISSLMNMNFGPLSLKSANNEFGLFGFESLRVAGINIDGDKYSIDEGYLLNTELLSENNSPLLRTDKIFLNQLEFTPSAMMIDRIEFDKIASTVVLNDAGEIEAINKIQKIFPAQNEPLEKTTTDQNPANAEEKLSVIINSIELKNSELNFTDNSVTPIFRFALHEIDINVENIDQRKIDSVLKVGFNAKAGEYGKIKINAAVQPFLDKESGEIKVTISSLDLVPLSSYSAKSAGLAIKKGMLNADANINIVNKMLNVENNFYFEQLTLEDEEIEVDNDFLSSLPMPLDMMLDVLRDKDNTIHLTIPVEGDIQDPKFELQDIYNKAMLKALTFSATYYLSQMVQPLGLIYSAGNLIHKGMAPSFEPIIYTPGVEKLSPENQTHLKNIAQLLTERDKLRITLCAVSSETDWLKLQELAKEASAEKAITPKVRVNKLVELANKRAAQAKAFFVEQQKIDPARIFVCNSKIHEDVKERPMLNISL